MWVANILGGTITLVIGIVIRVFNASSLIAGYNTASAAERAKYDEKALTRFAGNLLIAASLVLLAGGLLPAAFGAPDAVAGASWVLIVGPVCRDHRRGHRLHEHRGTLSAVRGGGRKTTLLLRVVRLPPRRLLSQ